MKRLIAILIFAPLATLAAINTILFPVGQQDGRNVFSFSRPSPVDPSLLAWWKFEDASGTQALDSVCGFTANPSGTVTPNPTNGIIGNSFDIQGGNNISAGMDIGDPDAFTFTNSTNDAPFTCAAWVYFSNDGFAPIFAKSDFGNNKREYLFYCSESQNYHLTMLISSVIWQNSIGRTMTASVPVGSWQHVCVTYDGSKLASGICIYTNGIRTDNADNSFGTYAGMSNTTTKAAIGRDWNNGNVGNSFPGRIDEMQVWARALSSNEVYQLCH